MGSPKRHHYLPQFYLDGFCTEGGLWVYDKEAQESRPQTPINTGVRQYYYRFEYDDAEPSYEVEEFLSEVESGTAPVIAKLRNREEIDEDERGYLAFFLATLLGRTPSAQKKHDKVVDAFTRDTWKRRFPTPDSLREFFAGRDVEGAVDVEAFHESLHGDGYRLVPHRNESIKAMLDMADSVSLKYFRMDWHVMRPANDRKSFITSDTPIVHAYDEPPPVTLDDAPEELHEGIQVIAPLAQDCLLLMENDMGVPGFGSLDDDDVRGFNLSLAAAADRFVIGRDSALVESVVGAASRERLVAREFDETLELAVAAARKPLEDE